MKQVEVLLSGEPTLTLHKTIFKSNRSSWKSCYQKSPHSPIQCKKFPTVLWVHLNRKKFDWMYILSNKIYIKYIYYMFGSHIFLFSLYIRYNSLVTVKLLCLYKANRHFCHLELDQIGTDMRHSSAKLPTYPPTPCHLCIIPWGAWCFADFSAEFSFLYNDFKPEEKVPQNRVFVLLNVFDWLLWPWNNAQNIHNIPTIPRKRKGYRYAPIAAASEKNIHSYMYVYSYH